METGKRTSVKQKLILAGIEEIEEQGIQNFSMRRVASRCDVSCAAPYKHFVDKNDFIMSIVQYINHEWNIIQKDIADNAGPDLKELIIDISMAYIRFLIDNPQFRSIIMLKDVNMPKEFQRERLRLSNTTGILVKKYCKQVDMPEDVMKRKLYIVRSLIYGAALMVDNGELQYTEDIEKQVRWAINREFEIE